MSGPRVGWHPLDLGRSQLIAWWCADDHVPSRMTDDGSGLISSWTDRISGIAVTGSTTARPTWGATGWTGDDSVGRPAVTFDGAATRLAATSFGALPTSTSPGEIWAAAASAGDNVTRTIAVYGSTANGAFRRVTQSNVAIPNCGDGLHNVSSSSDLTKTWNGAGIAGGAFDQAAYTFRFNGTVGPPLSTTLNTGGGTLRLALGASNGNTAGNFWSGPLRHVLVTTLLGAADRQRMEGWLAWDGGIQGRLAPGHPYGQSPP